MVLKIRTGRNRTNGGPPVHKVLSRIKFQFGALGHTKFLQNLEGVQSFLHRLGLIFNNTHLEQKLHFWQHHV